jgi:glutamyl-tRNA reductase
VLDDLGLIGVTWRQGGAQSLTEFTLDETTAGERLREFARAMQLRELGYLATCNRVELIFARSDATPSNDLRQQAFELLRGRAPLAGEAERRLKAWHGEGAAEHLFLVAAGLDSACVGETEIVGQVRRSYERTLELGLSGPALGLVFEEAQRIAARVRGQTRVGEGRVSLAEIAAQMMLERADDNATIALIGVSPMTQRAARTIVDSACTLLFVNRTAAKAERFAGCRDLVCNGFRPSCARCCDPAPHRRQRGRPRAVDRRHGRPT